MSPAVGDEMFARGDYGADLVDEASAAELAARFTILFRPCVDPEEECGYQFS